MVSQPCKFFYELRADWKKWKLPQTALINRMSFLCEIFHAFTRSFNYWLTVFTQCLHIWAFFPVWLPCASDSYCTDWRLSHTTYMHGIYSSLFWTVFSRSFLPRKKCVVEFKILSTNLWSCSLHKLETNSLFVGWGFSIVEQILCGFGEQTTSTPAFCSPWEVILACDKQLQGGFSWSKMEVSSYQWGIWVVFLQCGPQGYDALASIFAYNRLKYPKAAIISWASPYKLSKFTVKGRPGVGFYTAVS